MTTLLDPIAYKQQVDAASLAEGEGKLAAEMADVAALQRETDRKLELARALSTTRAQASGAGIVTNVGSPLTILESQIEQEAKDTQRDKFNARIAAQSAKYQAAARAGQIRGAAGLSLLKSIDEQASYFASGPSGSVIK